MRKSPVVLRQFIAAMFCRSTCITDGFQRFHFLHCPVATTTSKTTATPNLSLDVLGPHGLVLPSYRIANRRGRPWGLIYHAEGGILIFQNCLLLTGTTDRIHGSSVSFLRRRVSSSEAQSRVTENRPFALASLRPGRSSCLDETSHPRTTTLMTTGTTHPSVTASACRIRSARCFGSSITCSGDLMRCFADSGLRLNILVSRI